MIPPEVRNEVRVLRVAEGTEMLVLSLSTSYGGMFTHFWQKRSRYCAGDECKQDQHRTERYWKGYFAALVYDPRKGDWPPIVFELTEHGELPLRGRFRRGQLWRFWKENGDGKKKEKQQAELIEQRDEESLLKPFDVRPILRTFYHVQELQLNVANPLPAKVIVPSAIVEPPPGYGTRKPAPETMSPETLELLRRARKGIGEPVNGKGEK